MNDIIILLGFGFALSTAMVVLPGFILSAKREEPAKKSRSLSDMCSDLFMEIDRLNAEILVLQDKDWKRGNVILHKDALIRKLTADLAKTPHSLLIAHAYVHCHKCGQNKHYGDCVLDRDAYICPDCVAKREAAKKPLLADAQVGWICTHRDGSETNLFHIETEKILNICGKLFPIYTRHATHQLDGRISVFGIDNKHDIISCRPPEGDSNDL